MATDKPRFSITVSDDVYRQINEYQHEHRLATQTKAVLAFIEKGLEVVQKEKKFPADTIELVQYQAGQKSSDLSPIEQDHIKKYRSLDPYGKEVVDSVLDIEHSRCTEQVKSKVDIAAEVASYQAELELQEEVDGKSSAFGGSGDTGGAKMV